MAEVYNSASDFVLFPRDQTYPDTLDQRAGDHFISTQYMNPSFTADMNRHRDFSGHANGSYETYPPVSAYSSAYSAASTASFDARKRTMGPSGQQIPSSGSPSPSTSQTFDHPPSTVSSASGASAQSTASSADGSPYANATHNLPYEEKWPEPLHGLGLAPEIVTTEGFNNDSFPPSNFDHELMLEGNKFANYVGECGENFLQSFPTSHSLSSSVSSPSAQQNFLPAFSFPTLALDTAICPQDVTIDSILEEANSKIRQPTHLVSPVSATSTATSPASFPDKIQNASPTEPRPLFRSPRTPASAVSRLPSRAGSPHCFGEPDSQSHAALPLDRPRVQSSSRQSPSRFNSYGCTTPPPSSPGQAHYEKAPNPFFGQSSGRFVAPLESSCWFSLLSPSHFFPFWKSTISEKQILAFIVSLSSKGQRLMNFG